MTDPTQAPTGGRVSREDSQEQTDDDCGLDDEPIEALQGSPALTDLTLDVPAGTVFGFLGPNGAGKTTAMKLLAGLAQATSGTATINGIPVSASGAHRRELGYLPRTPGSTDG